MKIELQCSRDEAILVREILLNEQRFFSNALMAQIHAIAKTDRQKQVQQ